MNRTKELKIPFAWKDRRPVLLNRFFYVPNFYDKHGEFPPLCWSDPMVFGNNRPVFLEYCSGNGQWICEKAKAHPDWNWVALDIRFDRCKKIWNRLHREGLDNLYVICADANIATKYYIPRQALREIFMNFPDPWPKLRHAKHRLVQEPFVKEVQQRLLPGGKATFVTDDAPYAAQIIRVVAALPSWRPLLESPFYLLNPPDYGASFFADLWIKKGRDIYFLPFETIYEDHSTPLQSL